MTRRHFLQTATIAFPAILLAQKPSRIVRIAVAGMGGRGNAHAGELARLADVEVACVCDPDEKRAASAAAAVEKLGRPRPRRVADFRTLLDDRTIDAVAFATPNHWHAPGAILAMTAGKHVYVEKPCSHNAHEGELLVAAARKHGRLCQHGTQRRSWPGIREAIERVRAGEIGRVLSARAYYFNARPSIGNGRAVPVPGGLDWALWQGPAPEREFRDNFLHYHWHWFWHWGGGELGNNGVHMLDLCRWGLGAAFPRSAASVGAKLGFPDDDQETPDALTTGFDFATPAGPASIAWECRSWANRTPADPKHDVAFLGEKGALLITGGGYTIHDQSGAEIAKGSGSAGDTSHFQNFVDAIRGDAMLNAEIEEGHRSTLLCHLGNIAWRTGHTARFDEAKQRADDATHALWSREYRPGWEPKV